MDETEPEIVTKWFVTFGVQYARDPNFGERHPMGMHADGFAVIEAPDEETARKIAFAIFGQKWSFLYGHQEWVDKDMEARWAPAGELLRIGWRRP